LQCAKDAGIEEIEQRIADAIIAGRQKKRESKDGNA
jgi:hypothetical protein